MKTEKIPRLTKLEKFVWNNRHMAFDYLATQLNTTIDEIDKANKRAFQKVRFEGALSQNDFLKNG